MKLKTVRVRRNRPSVLSAALALMLTMLFVYLISLSAASRPESAPAASQAIASSDVRMDGLSAAFECEGRYDLPLDARVAAAKCVQSGGAGLILPDGAQYAVVRSVSSAAEGENVIRRSAPGLTLRVSGPASELMAVADAVEFLRAQTTETGNLAQTLESGGADASTMATLLNIYRTRGEAVLANLTQIDSGNTVVSRLTAAVQSALGRLDGTAQPSPAQIRRIHAAACAQWLALLEEFAAQST